MIDCHRIDTLVTPYVDGDVTAADRDMVDAHLRVCRLCQGRVRTEQAVRELMRARRAALEQGSAPRSLRANCAALGPQSTTSPAPGWRARLAPLALAASLVLVVGGAFLYVLTEQSTTIMAAELTANHLKCFRLTASDARREPSVVESSMASSFGWELRLPQHPEQMGLELVDARPCIYGEGRAAHLMFRHHGAPMSIFMLPRSVRSEDRLQVLGHQASVWSVGNRTFVLITQEPADEVERMTAFVHASLR